MVHTRSQKRSLEQEQTDPEDCALLDSDCGVLNTLPCEPFDPGYKPFLNYTAKKDFYEELLRRKSSFNKLFLLFKRILLFIVKLKIKTKVLKTEDVKNIDFDKEAWLCILRSSQENFPPKKLKNTSIIKTNSVECASFKLSPMDRNEIFGVSKILLISNQDCQLVNRIIRSSHM